MKKVILSLLIVYIAMAGHAQEHMHMERCHAELYVWLNGREEFMEAVNSNIR